ncbi:MAG: helix-turn-helix domain-containing protein [Desulfuromonas sp.]|nr:helix-turn-helix domain-containing protein [Desulfuromonas sp.]
MAQLFTATKPLYHPREVAQLLQYKSLTSVYALINSGHLKCHCRKPGTKGIKITGKSLEGYLNNNVVEEDHYQE